MPRGIFDTIGTNVVAHRQRILRSRCVTRSCQFLRIACSVLWLLPCGLLPGCYDAELLVNQTREQAALVKLEEVEIDEFRVTLPRQGNSTISICPEWSIGFRGREPAHQVGATHASD